MCEMIQMPLLLLAIIELYWQMSGKSQIKPLLSRNAKVSEFIMLENTNSTFNSYDRAVEENLNIILQKYPNLDKKKVRDLLQELDNNRELTIEIVEKEHAHCNQIINQKRGNHHADLNLSKDEENRILKQSFLNLYKKLLAKTAEFDELSKKYESEKQQNQKLKLLNRFMMQGEFSQQQNDNSPSIC